jgi:tripartite-type tricarboxylate transporter receptor subunit TctC
VRLLAALAGLLLSLAAGAQQYPDRPVTIVSGFPPGGMVDIVARALAEGMRPKFPRGIVVLSRSGMGGAIAAGETVRAAPDGYTLTFAPKSALVIQPQLAELPYKSPADFAPVINVVSFYSLVVTRADAPWKTPQDLLQAARANPGKLRIGTPGEFTTPHLSLEQLKRLAGIEVLHVPFKGWAESSTALLGGHIDLAVAQPGELGALVEAKRIHVVGVFQPERNALFPAAPTFREAGFPVYAGTYFSLLAPKDTPPEVLKYLHDAAREAMEQRAFVDLARQRAVEVEYRSGERLRADLMEEFRIHTELLRSLGILKK